jgi:L-lactate dehydrogenase complex protein LldG
MAAEKETLIQLFAEKFTGVSGQFIRIDSAAALADCLAAVGQEKEIRSFSLSESTLSKQADLAHRLREKGFTVHTDDLKTHSETDHAGITTMQGAIAEIGTLVQFGTEVDERLCSTLVPIHIALLEAGTIVATLDMMLETLGRLSPLPAFVGFISGPSRSSDIERILEIGVHGPKQVICVLIDG